MDAERPELARRKRWLAGVVAGGAAVGMMLAGLGIAAAQTDGTTTTAPPIEGAPVPAPEKDAGAGERPFARGMFGKPGGRSSAKAGIGTGGGIHGEHTRPARDGGYQTIATQDGEVTAVSGSSITVKSEDGFTRTYAVDDNTLVEAGDDGIADVRTGDQVHVTALVVDGKANAVEVQDVTRVRELRDRWAPGRR